MPHPDTEKDKETIKRCHAHTVKGHNLTMKNIDDARVEMFHNRVFMYGSLTFQLLQKTLNLLTSRDITPQSVTDLAHEIESLLLAISHGPQTDQTDIDRAVENRKNLKIVVDNGALMV